MRILTLPVDLSLFELRREVRYTWAILRQRKWAATRVLIFEGLLKEVAASAVEREALFDKLEDANAAVDDADIHLDDFVSSTATLLREALNKNTDAPLWRSMFGTQRPSDLIRPKLGEELERVRQWPPLLRTAPTQALRDSAAVCESLVQAADAALHAQNAATSAVQVFHASKVVNLINQVNGERNSLGGEADKLAFDQKVRSAAIVGLFRQAPRSRAPRSETLDSVRAEITTAEQQLMRLRQRLSELETEQQTQAALAEQRRIDEAALLSARAQQEEAAQKIAALEKRLKS